MNKMDYRIKVDAINKPFRFLYQPDYQPKDYNIIYGGTGSGKSVVMSRVLVKWCLEHPGIQLAVVKKVFKGMKKTVIPEFINPTRGALKYYHLDRHSDYTYNITDSEITFANGSKIYFTGYQDPEVLKGIQIDGIWMEEATDFNPDDIGLLKDRMRGIIPHHVPWNVKPIFMTFNPVNVDHHIRLHYMSDYINKEDKIWVDYPRDPETTDLVKVTWRDNMYYGEGNYANDRIRNEKWRINPRLAEVEDYGNHGVLGEIIYENTTVMSMEEIKETFNIKRISYGLDFGHAHATAMSKIAYDEDKKTIIVLDELYEAKLTPTKLYEAIIHKFGHLQYDIIADCARPEIIEEFQDRGLYMVKSKKGDGSVLDGIEFIQDHRLVIASHCTGHVNEVNSYTWKKDKTSGVKTSKPVKEKDDAMDSLRYGTQPWRQGHTGWY